MVSAGHGGSGHAALVWPAFGMPGGAGQRTFAATAADQIGASLDGKAALHPAPARLAPGEHRHRLRIPSFNLDQKDEPWSFSFPLA